jgi:hypothetical protein
MMEEVTVSFGLKDITLMVGVGVTMVGIGLAVGQAKNEFAHLRAAVAKLETILTNGLSRRVENIERHVQALPCAEDDCPNGED